MRTNEDQLPRISRFWLSWFSRYVLWFLKRNFHGVHLLRLGQIEALAGKPLLVCTNHPGWWDPLICFYLSQRFFPRRSHYGPMAAKAVDKYRFFTRVGFFGVQANTRAGAARFLSIGRAVLRNPDAALWVSPEGRFGDVRLRPVKFEPGVGHLPRHANSFVMLPVALEYAFWNERYPEAFVCIGEPVFVDEVTAGTPDEWSSRFALALQHTQDALAAQVKGRSPAAFEPLVAGNAGVGGIYDLWRAARARLQGRKFEAQHGNF